MITYPLILCGDVTILFDEVDVKVASFGHSNDLDEEDEEKMRSH